MSELRLVRRRSAPLAAWACLGALLTLAAGAATAHGAISQPALVDGPSATIIDLGGVDMAADGTGGLVFRKRVDGRARIFAARFDGSAWSDPVRVDAGQQFDSSWPQIGAGEGGRLLVTWVQEFGTGTDRMFSASLGPGASRFQSPIPVDFNVGEATATYPSLAMNAVGTAYLAYRVVYATTQTNATLPPGTVDADVRIARTTGALWSVIGQPIDRNAASPVAIPTAANSPRIGVDQNGNAVVAWQEPDDAQIDRVWARRVFGLNPGLALQVSPSKLGDAALPAGADAFALSVAGFGEAAVAFRQQAAPAAGLAATRIFTSTIPEAFSEKAAAFVAARIADGAGVAGPDAPLGRPTVAVSPRGRLLAGYGAGLASFAGTGDDTAAGPATRLDDGASSVSGDPVVQIGSDGAAVMAWKVLQGGLGGVTVQESRADGVVTKDVLSAPQGGVVADLRSAGSGLGDAVMAFLQGTGAGTQIAAGAVNAPPQQFAVQAPIGFVRSDEVPITWDRAEHAIGAVSYEVSVDDRAVKENLTSTRARLDDDDVDDGVHTIVVTATDDAGQPTESIPAQLRVDRRKPVIAVRRRGRVVSVTIADGRPSETSGVSAAATTVSFGEGKAIKGRRRNLRHTYRRGGRFRVSVKTRDKAGNSGTLRRTVTIR